MRRRWIVVLIACMTLMGPTIAHAGSVLEKIVGGPGEQYWPSSNGTVVAYSQYLRRHTNVLAMNETTGTTMRANTRTTSGTMGSFVQGSTEFVYQQYRDHSDLYFFDVSNRHRSAAPNAVNRVGWAYWPVASEDFILFMRATHRFKTRSLKLYDREADTIRTLIGDIGGKTVFPGFVGSRYAAWTTCGSQACSVSIYDSTTHATTKLPTPATKSSYAPAIDEATDQIYFVRGPADKCGVNITIRVGAVGSDQSTSLAALPRGIDTGWTLSLTSNTGSGFLDLYFERWECKEGRGDVYAVRSVDAPGLMRVLGPPASGPYAHPVARKLLTAGAGGS